MRIGIDLDGVIFDSEKELRVYSELYDMIDLNQNSKIDNKELMFQDRFKWTKKDIEGFLKKYHKQIIIESNYLPGVKRVLKMLKQDGHSLILISARGYINRDMIHITEQRLKKDEMNIFDKYYWRTLNKDEICIKENIDIMIDDSDNNCKILSDNKIRTIYLKDAPSHDLKENEYIKVLYNWGEIYRYIKEIDNTITDKLWNEEKYKDFVKYLINLQDKKYKEFHSSLVLNSKYEIIGIRVPVLRNIAKKIAKNNIDEFLKYSKNKYYEEVMIKGLVISNIKDEKNFYKYFKEYINAIDNWALCDTFCSSIKIVKKYEEKYFKEAIKLALKKEEFLSRVGLIMILNYFIKQDNLNTIFDILNKIQSDKFYINMAEAWLICEMYIKYPRETKKFLTSNNLNKFTQNKAISKIHDSNRITKEEKELLNKLRK